MKLIDLLNKIANGEENDLQTEFEFDGKIWNFYKFNHSEYCLDGWLLNQNITITKHKEILEEEKKIPEKIDHLIGYDIQQFDDLKEYVEITTNDLFGKINKVIDTLDNLIDYLKSKGE